LAAWPGITEFSIPTRHPLGGQRTKRCVVAGEVAKAEPSAITIEANLGEFLGHSPPVREGGWKSLVQPKKKTKARWVL